MEDLEDIDLVELMEKVPEFKPLVITLAWEIVEKGDIVPRKAALKAKELIDALDEAEDNGHVTKELVKCLMQLAQ